MVSIKFLTGAAIGYVLGSRGGREHYEKIMAKVQELGGGELMDKVGGAATGDEETRTAGSKV